jgi:redox-sensitive bicupin YhaK (pirin superfamily)
MNQSSNEDPKGDDAIETVILPRSRDLGDGFEVRRVLPFAQRRMVGPFVFFDHFGPTVFRAGTGLDVRPHPHIGLATVTYLFAGEILHRDSIGSVQPIRAGEVNWMTAGRGIAHSERTPVEVRRGESQIFGVQLWVGLPRAQEETVPAFHHHPAADLPIVEGEGKRLRVIAGSFEAARAPVQVFADTLCADVELAAGARLALGVEHEERSAYVVAGDVEIGTSRFEAGRLLVLRPGELVVITARSPARLLLLGGAAMDGPRHIWWNFVSSSKERIEQAKADWQAGRFDRVIGETEFIPLPQ